MSESLEGVVHVSLRGKLVYVITDVPAAAKIGHGRMIRRRVMGWPAAARCEGHRVRVTAKFTSWRNGLGWYPDRPTVECLEPEEHILAALAGTRRT